MATLDVVTIENQKAGSVDLDPTVFEAPVRKHLLHAEVRRQLAKRRAGTHSSKNRAIVSGGGAKPWRQKGTGRARQGTTRAPQWAGGGAVFGPVPRGYDHKLPKKSRQAALRSALSERHAAGALTVVETFEVDEYRTKRVVAMLESLGLGGVSVLLVTDDASPHLERSARNLRGVSVIRAEGLNVYDVLRHQKLVASRSAIDAVAARLRKIVKGESA
jgi:large subunit ribosomal protein L4